MVHGAVQILVPWKWLPIPPATHTQGTAATTRTIPLPRGFLDLGLSNFQIPQLCLMEKQDKVGF
jgi:hypothetical protein